MSTQPTNMDDVIDSRDVIARLEELQDEQRDLAQAVEEAQAAFNDADGIDARDEAMDWLTGAENALSEWEADNLEELEALRELNEQGEDYAPDWRHGETLIRDSYFEQYAEELAEDIGAVQRGAQWPNNCIDWAQAARELQQDYTQIDFDGVSYWVRG
ncbi:hypothetical protein CAL26_21255 [Bordetella genomosp. 9]|uniref:Uncharacterized protein n=1 Tax=Bordetella genomosp. 9 TaxID=1416803 RepID=A0A261R4X6_9BORD|nr:hypothetical protein [Bordetella genomosp. 9]OZI20085.1 hypothetical protein CAL26_21255 [Bordetella genomosp. 9]